MPFKRLLDPIYEDDIGKPLTSVAGRTLPLVREVSNSLAREGLIDTLGRDEGTGSTEKYLISTIAIVRRSQKKNSIIS